MNCDQVFQQLSSAQLPSRHTALQRHLDGCSSCRQMAELFLPAVRLLAAERADEHATIDEVRPRWTDVWEAVSLAERTASQLEEFSSPGAWQRGRPASLLRMAVVLLVGVVLGILCPRASSNSSVSESYTHSTNVHGQQSQECRYEDFVTDPTRFGAIPFCANCRPKVAAELASVATVCMVCHRLPADDLQVHAERRPLF